MVVGCSEVEAVLMDLWSEVEAVLMDLSSEVEAVLLDLCMSCCTITSIIVCSGPPFSCNIRQVYTETLCIMLISVSLLLL